MAGNPGALALDGGDPRRPDGAGIGEVHTNYTVGTGHTLHDSSVSFEEYLYYAQESRANAEYENPDHSYTFFGKVIKKGKYHKGAQQLPTANGSSSGVVEKESDGNEKQTGESGRPAAYPIKDEDYLLASRAGRTATWGAVFYLITTDILGPFSTPWAFAAMGYGPGVILYTVFGIMAGYGGFLLWRMFLGLDSDRYPLKTYGDIAFRVFGSVCRYVVNTVQSVQLLFNVGIIIIVSGQSLAQIISTYNRPNVCFIILCLVWAIAGMLVGQIRTLQKLGWLANAAIWMNLVIIFSTMGIVANSGVLTDAAVNLNSVFGVTPGQPITKTAGARPGTDFTVQAIGLMQAVYSYGGAMLFVEFMSEMKRPFDFWKGMILAQTFIYFFYMLFGLFVYSYQGQYSINPAYQGIASATWQTVANVLGLISGLIAALLYGNIGIKVIYNNMLMDFFRFPSLVTHAGKIAWVAVVPIYWAVAFIVAAAIPQVSNLSGLIGAACILQFSYTFPPFFMLGYLIKKDAMLPGEGFDPVTGTVVRHDSGMKRWARGFRKQLWLNLFNVVLFLGSTTTAILGIYSASLGIKSAYASGATPSFGCKNPFVA